MMKTKTMKVFGNLTKRKKSSVHWISFVLDLEGFIVDDEEEDGNNGYDYRKDLHETLRSNFGFDREKYRRRILDDDDDDLRNMESSFDQIEREEDFR